MGAIFAGLQMIKVLHIVHAFQTGGAERVILNLIQHGDKQIANHVCSLCEPHELVSQLDLSSTGFDCLKKQPGNDLRVAREIARLIDENSVDVVHAQGWGTFIESLLAAKWLAKRRPAFIYAFHGKGMADVSHGIPLRRRIAQRIAHAFTDACIAPAKHMVADYAQIVGMNQKRVELIYNGVDLKKFDCPRSSDVRRSLGLESSDFVVGFVGRLNAVKDILGLVRVIAKVQNMASELPRAVRLLVVGEGTERVAAERLAAELGVTDKIRFVGLRSDIAQCLACMDVYLQPSYYEGHSIAILEAMASGLPVVSTSVGGTPEIVAHGKTGFLYLPGEYDRMAKAVIELRRRQDMCKAIGDAGRERVAKRFSVEAMVARYEDLYSRVLQRQDSRS